MVVPDEIGGFAEFMHQSIRASEMSLQGPSRNSDQNLRRETEHKNTVGFERLPTITDSEGNSERESTLLTKGQVEAFREVFELFDKNGNLAFFCSNFKITVIHKQALPLASSRMHFLL